MYPLGYPGPMAAATAVGGDRAAVFVVPLCAALLVLAIFHVGASTGTDPWVGVVAAALVAVSPVTFVSSVVPMSDVPATAFWIWRGR